ncbi:Radical SAM superfamily protein [Posidoniimonas polymericola]|uniref:Radical SAM superfamily protein n=1 Tax=Posidoniimonas polymericola TaxID=2528002 RepID=A0A5C5YEG6_9BACT|nr:radical SAM protein [Posidoniimonas polymericola]TWT73740.1 Radical SAM superfamily protein [Posidoniimonas polymericola]
MSAQPLYTQHQRLFAGNKFVYPVLSRRSGGISVGVNLNPDKVCNFDCVYCQVDRTTQSPQRFVEVDRLITELRDVLTQAHTGALYDTPKFAAVPPALRRLNDLAFSGDGEPTTFVNFDELMQRSAQVKRELGLDDVKMVLITNASMLHRPRVQQGLATLDANQGEIWAKLDAGTEAYYRQIMRTVIPLTRVLENLTTAARTRPLVIQTLFCTLDGAAPSPSELGAYCDSLNEITAAGGQLSRVQIYTVARRPAESTVGPLPPAEVDRIVELVHRRTGIDVQGYY